MLQLHLQLQLGGCIGATIKNHLIHRLLLHAVACIKRRPSCMQMLSVQQRVVTCSDAGRADCSFCLTHRFSGEDGHVSEFELRPSWRLPLQEAPEDWDINPATEDLPLDRVLAAAAAVRREHLAG